jgi:diguanylate cyclase (GGDEF)-like protein/PAS domain S-box-containing protein
LSQNDPIVVDLKRSRTSNRLAASPDFLELLMSTVDDAVVCVGAERDILMLNSAAASLLGVSRETAIGQPIDHFGRIDTQGADLTFDAAIADALDGTHLSRFARCELLRHTGGTSVPVSLTIKSVPASTGLKAALIVFHDRTEAVTLQKSLAQSERRVSSTLDTGRFGIWEWCPQTDEVKEFGYYTSILGHQEGDHPTNSAELFERVHPDDRKVITDAIRAYFRGQIPVIEVEYRNRDKDGRYHWTLVRGRAVEFDADGRITHFLGTHTDIDELKRAQAALADSGRLLDIAMRGARQSMWDWNLETDELVVSDAWETLRNPAAEDVRSLRVDMYKDLHPDDHEATRAALTAVLRGDTETYDIEHRVRGEDGSYKWFMVRGAVVERGADGRALHMTGTHTDITELKDAQFARERSDRVLSIALESGQQGVWEWYPEPDRLVSYGYWDHDLVFGSKDAVPSSEELLRNTHPDDVESVKAAMFAHLRGEIEYYDVEQRLRHADGSYNRFLVRGKTVERDDGGNPIKVIGTHTNITALSDSQQMLRIALETSRQGLWEWHPKTDKIRLFDSWTKLFGYDDSEIANVRKDFTKLVHPEDVEHTRLDTIRLLKERDTLQGEFRLRHSNGQYLWVLARVTVVDRDEHGHATRIIGSHLDISAVKQAERDAESSRRFLELVLNTIPDRVFWKNKRSEYLGCNRAYANDAGLSDPRAICGRTDYEMPWAENAELYRKDDAEIIVGGKELIRAERPFIDNTGTEHWLETTKVPLRDADGETIGVLGAFRDITERKRAEEEIQRLAFYDSLTNLPNRRYLIDRLRAALSSTARRKTNGAVLFIDLDQFKNINDSLGHSIGDALLVHIAKRLDALVREEDMVARLGGDEFVVLLPELTTDRATSTQRAQRVAEKIHHELAKTHTIAGHEFYVTPTIGITLFPGSAKTVDDVLKQADSAMYRGKAEGRNLTRVYHPSMQAVADDRLAMEKDLRLAVRQGRFELNFQPQLNRTQRVFGCEALLRWDRPDHGYVPPATFIRVAEDSGLILELGDWVMRRAFEKLRLVEKQFPGMLQHLSVNVSSFQFRSRDFVGRVKDLIENTGVTPNHVVLEVTESTVIENIEQTIAKMKDLRGTGIRFSIDDFGVGYSSLAYLSRLPLDQLKIDRSFVTNVLTDSNDAVIAETIISMSKHLGMETIAEGVETMDQFEFLLDKGCQGFQGDLFCKPVAFDKFIERYGNDLAN